MQRSYLNRGTLAVALAAAALVAGQHSASAAVGASATYSYQQLDATTYRYSLTLNNTGTTPIQAFWFSWVPGDSFMDSVPANIASPAGWSGSAFPDLYGNSVLWTTSSTGALASGASLQAFAFDSQDTPAKLAGLDSYYNYYPVGTFYVYQGAPEASPGAQFLATAAPTPEPTTALTLTTLGGLAALSRRRHRRV